MTIEQIIDAIEEEAGSYYATACCECDEFCEGEEQDCANCFIVTDYIRIHGITIIEE